MSDERDYILGFDEPEQRRLVLQDQLFGGFTRALLLDAGIAPGMHVLDVGSGVGDVSMLAAECVGPTGSVLGVEQSPAYVAAARRRAAARNLTHIEFIEGDLFEVVPERSFDLVVGRFVLEWLPDPIRAVRHLATRVRPGGALVFQDYDHPLHEGQYSFPVAPYFERVLDACIDALAKHGLNRRMGALLRQTFLAAELRRRACASMSRWAAAPTIPRTRGWQPGHARYVERWQRAQSSPSSARWTCWTCSTCSRIAFVRMHALGTASFALRRSSALGSASPNLWARESRTRRA